MNVCRAWSSFLLVCVALGLTACGDEAGEGRPDLLDDYQAGYTAGKKLFDDYHPEQNDYRKCVDKARDATGYQVDVSDEARVYWSACLDALDGHDYTPSAQALEAMLSKED